MYKKLSNWIFNRDVLPYWCVLVVDWIIIVFAAIICILIDRGPNINLFLWARRFVFISCSILLDFA